MAGAGECDATRLVAAAKAVLAGEPAVGLDYFEIVDADSLDPVNDVARGALVAVAAFVGTTRLIDNILLPAN
jgi:pantoate--beta-alanine ligase